MPPWHSPEYRHYLRSNAWAIRKNALLQTVQPTVRGLRILEADSASPRFV